MKLTVASLLVATILAGCDQSPAGSLPLQNPRLSAQRVYAGAAITIYADHLSNQRDTIVFADGVPVSMSVRGGDSAVIRIPPNVSGNVKLTLGGASGYILGFVEVRGFLQHKPVTDDIGFYLDVWPEGAQASVIAGNQNGDVLQLLPATGALRQLLHGYRLGWTDARTPGRTPDPAVVLLQPRAGPLQKWRLLPQPVLVGTLPAYNGGITPCSTTRPRWLERITTGPPVFSMSTGDTVYHVRQLFRSYGASFSEYGDTLWMLGVTREFRSDLVDRYPAVLLALDARTGTELRRFEFNDRGALAMRRDPQGGRIFVAAYPGNAPADTPIELFVIDEKTFELLGHIEAPRELTCPTWCDYAVVALGADGVFIVHPRHIFEFEYMK